MKAISRGNRRSAIRIMVMVAVSVAALVFVATAVPITSTQRVPAGVPVPQTKRTLSPDHLISALRKLPIPFEPNVGETASRIKYVARANGDMVGLTERGLILKLEEPNAPRPPLITSSIQQHPRYTNAAPVLVSIRPIHARSDPPMQPERKLASISNYFIGNNPKEWHTRVPNYAAVRYLNLYPGIDWTVHGNPNRLEYDLRIAPHANPGAIRFRITGADGLSLDRQGNLVISVAHRSLQELKPVIYQVGTDNVHQRVSGHYVLEGQQVAFALGPYDHARTLVIDPVLEYSTYLGGSCSDSATAVAVDDSGDAYVTGNTCSIDFPTVNPVQGTNKGNNIFISKFNASGSALVYSTFLGGTNGSEAAHGIAVDNAGNVYVTGTTFAEDFPTVNAFQTTNKSKGNPPAQAFVTKLNAAGDALVYSTYLGGSGQGGVSLDHAMGIAVDGTGEAYVTGLTNSPDFPIVNAFQSTFVGSWDVFVTKFNAAGNGLVYSTFLGGNASQQGNAIAIDAAGSAYITGYTSSTNFPLVDSYESVDKAGSTHNTGFVTKFSPSGTTLDYSTYLGGSNENIPLAIAIDGNGDAYVAGWTYSTDFPVVNPYQSQLLATTGGGNAFVTKFNAAGNALIYSTYLGGSGDEFSQAFGIAVDDAGDAWAVGNTDSTDFPTVDPLQAANKAAIVTGDGDTDGFVTEFDAAGNTLLFSTYWGGSGSWGPTQVHTTVPFGDSAYAVALDNEGNVHVAGTTGSADFPTCRPFQANNKTATTYGTSYNAFVTKIAPSASSSEPCSVAPPGPIMTASSSGGGGGALGWLSVFAFGLIVLMRGYEIRNRKANF